jgi:hypothetical protein
VFVKNMSFRTYWESVVGSAWQAVGERQFVTLANNTQIVVPPVLRRLQFVQELGKHFFGRAAGTLPSLERMQVLARKGQLKDEHVAFLAANELAVALPHKQDEGVACFASELQAATHLLPDKVVVVQEVSAGYARDALVLFGALAAVAILSECLIVEKQLF